MHPVCGDGRTHGRGPDGKTTDFPSGGQVSSHQVRGNRKHYAVIVEPMFERVIRWQQRSDIDVNCEQIPDCSVIFGTIEAMKRLSTPWVWIDQAHRIDFRLQPGRYGMIRGLVRARIAHRRHRLRPKLAYHPLPELCVSSHARQVCFIERQSCRERPPVVATNTETVEHLSSHRGIDGTRCTRLLGTEALRPPESHKHPKQHDKASGAHTSADHPPCLHVLSNAQRKSRRRLQPTSSSERVQRTNTTWPPRQS